MAIKVKFLLSLVVVVNIIAVISFFSLSKTSQLDDTPLPKNVQQRTKLRQEGKSNGLQPNSAGLATHKPLDKQPDNKKSNDDSNGDTFDQFSKASDNDIDTSQDFPDQALLDSDDDIDDPIDSVGTVGLNQKPVSNQSLLQKNSPKSQSTAQSNSQNKSIADKDTNSTLYTIDPDIMSIGPGAKKTHPQTSQSYDQYMSLMGLQDDAQFINMNKKIVELNDTLKHFTQLAGAINPFRLLGFYKELNDSYFNSQPGVKPHYDKNEFNIRKNPSYCDYTDIINLFNPSSSLTKINFFAEYAPLSLPRVLLSTLGTDMAPNLCVKKANPNFPDFELDIRTNNFFTKRTIFHYENEIGKQFLCATQIYNHIPGHDVLIRKDLAVGTLNDYSEMYRSKPKCFNKETYFPYAYRLNNETECKHFFAEINDPSFEIKKKENLQYIIKVGYNAHRGKGIFLFGEKEEIDIRDRYNNGEWCGKIDLSLLAQHYIPNPLTLDRQNKFDFRMYMLIASVDPLIAYYHDGFLRVSLATYNATDTSKREAHLTNTHLSKKAFADVDNATLEEELRDYQMWTFEELQEYLLNIKKISDPDWLNNYLRPNFKKAYLHLIRMSKHAYWKHSSVYEMFGLDFILDDNLQLWFLEANGSPQLIGTNPKKEKIIRATLTDLFEIEYAYLRSKLKRIFAVVHDYMQKISSPEPFDLEDMKAKFARANRNFLEPNITISSNNSWHKILDENLPGKAAYMGNLEDECLIELP